MKGYLKRFTRNFTGLKTAYEDVLYEKKKLIAERDMIGDADNIAHLFKQIVEQGSTWK